MSPAMVTSERDAPGWDLTIEGAEYVAYRPIGWEGPEPHARVAAATREDLIRKIKEKEDPRGWLDPA